MKRVLITGGAGMIGSHLAHWILENKKASCLVIIDDLSGGYIENIPADMKNLFYKLTDAKNLFYKQNLLMPGCDSIFKEYRPDVVYHLAAYAAEGLSPFIRQYNYQNNIVASAAVINNCIQYNVKKLVFTSSIAVYGDKNIAPFSELTAPSPKDPYGLAKYTVEQDLEIAKQQHGLDYTILRPYNVVGENQNIWDRYRNVFGIWSYKLLTGQRCMIYGDGTQVRSFTDVKSILEPMWNANSVQASHNVFNLGSNQPISLNEAFQLFVDIVGPDIKNKDLLVPIYTEPRFEGLDCWCDNRKAKQYLGYTENGDDLKNAITRLWDWAKIEYDRRQPKMFNEPYEITKGIYEFWK